MLYNSLNNSGGGNKMTMYIIICICCMCVSYSAAAAFIWWNARDNYVAWNDDKPADWL